MVLNDIYAGHGVGLVDPHGDFAEKIIDFIPPHRINDIVYFNPADMDYPIGFNILESVDPEYRHLVASGLMGVFKKIWPDVWSARMEYILNNTILALLDYPGTTLLGINRLLADDDYREKVVAVLKDPVVKAFWESEFAKYEDRFRREAIAPIQNKIGQFLSASIIRNIVAQVKSRINIREIMDTQKIFIMNLSKGRIGEDNSRLMGGMLITKIQLSAMERVDTPEKDRKDFFLYVDEFQNFATESFANILSEARKYRLDLIMAHQYMEQLDETVLAAVIGNVGTMVTFRVGSSDAEILAKEFIPTFVEEDLINLPKYHIYLKLMIDGVASRPFSALTLPPIGSSTASREKVIRVSRERYAISRSKIEEKISRWSGSDGGADELDDEEETPHTTTANMVESINPHAPVIVADKVYIDSKTQNIVSPTVVAPKKSNTSNESPKYEKSGNAKPSLPRPQNSDSRPKNQNNGRSPQVNKNRDRDRGGDQKNKNRNREGNKNADFKNIKTEKVLLVDTDQKGISLSEVLKSSPPPKEPPSQPVSAANVQNNTPKPINNGDVSKQPNEKPLKVEAEASQMNPKPAQQSAASNNQGIPKAPEQNKNFQNTKPVSEGGQPKNHSSNIQNKNNGQNAAPKAQASISLDQLKSHNQSGPKPQNNDQQKTVPHTPKPQNQKMMPPVEKNTPSSQKPETETNVAELKNNDQISGPKTLQPGQVIKLD
jgi:hypothetical protein